MPGARSGRKLSITNKYIISKRKHSVEITVTMEESDPGTLPTIVMSN